MLGFIVRGAVLVLLIAAVGGKTSSREAFKSFAGSFGRVRSDALRTGLAYAVIAAEVLTAVALLLPAPRVIQFGPAFLLFGAFAVYLTVMQTQNADFDCHCFGSRTRFWSTPVHRLINAIVSAACVLVIFEGSGEFVTAPAGDAVFFTGLGVLIGFGLIALPAIVLPRVH